MPSVDSVAVRLTDALPVVLSTTDCGTMLASTIGWVKFTTMLPVGEKPVLLLAGVDVPTASDGGAVGATGADTLDGGLSTAGSTAVPWMTWLVRATTRKV